MLLYHFSTSPYARRVRLALAHKTLACELRDARARPEWMREVERLNPLHTVPVLVDGERVVIDSGAICHYLDRKVPAPALWPAGMPGAEAFELVALADGVINLLSDLGMRYYGVLHQHPDFAALREKMIGRAQRALDALADRVSRRTPGTPLCGSTWSAADMSVITLVMWLEGMPRRAASFAPARQLVSLGCTLPAALRDWADPHRERSDVRALDSA